MTEPYRHRWLVNTSNRTLPPVGKVVCVGRNYEAHARELNNPVPDEPIFFMKPATSLAVIEEGVVIPESEGAVHHELEIALLIGTPLSQAPSSEALAAVVGVGLALDLTLRDVQNRLKSLGHPWERAKAFDGACPVTGFILSDQLGDLSELALELQVNGKVQQKGAAAQMITPIPELVAAMSQAFRLQAGDIVLTGTPSGVGELHRDDQLQLGLRGNEGQGLLSVATRVIVKA